MPRRRRVTRPVRRPAFRPEPEAPSEEATEDTEEAPPSFADEPAVSMPVGFGASGPVETRPYWTAREQRTQGRRLAQLRRSSSSEERGTAARAGVGQLPTFDRAYISSELRRIVFTTAALSALIIVLTIVLR